MGLSHNISHTYTSNSIFACLWCRSCSPIGAPNSITKDCHSKYLSNEDNVGLRLEELEALDEKRLEAQQRLECYQARLTKAFNKKVKPRSFQVGDLVLTVRRPINMKNRMGNKFLSKWDGPYVV